uniref:Uncharacterized protein n=1 Tax=viral metagenome TaxID=1070528 RepID=A0A6M3LAX5_9ZZZZ
MGYIGYMAKYIVKAVTHRKQVRISMPALLLKEMGWQETAVFILEKANEEEVKIKQLYRRKDLE